MNTDRMIADRETRAERFAALGDPMRLHIVEALFRTDLTFGEVAEAVGAPSNLVAHHLGALEAVGIVARRASDGDRRRRYLQLRHENLPSLVTGSDLRARRVLFVCRRNSARSQLAAALWNDRSEVPAASAGLDPAPRVHPGALRVASRHGLDLAGSVPRSYADVTDRPDLLVSVCDVAREADPAIAATRRLHWSIPDPAETGTEAAFEGVWALLEHRIARLAPMVTSLDAIDPEARSGPSPTQRSSTT